MKTILITSFGLALLGVASAQETSHFAFAVDGGFTTPVGGTGRYTDYGWNAGGGIGYNFNSTVGALIDVNYNAMGINATTLANFGVPGGGLHVLSATLDPIVHLTKGSPVDVYLTGGGGIYHREQDFTASTGAVAPAFNPFFGFYSAAYPSNYIISSYSSNKPGVDGGVGIAFGSKWHGKFFAEARYNRIFGTYHTDYLPVSFGFRW